jgi:hypothetical protein
MIPLSCSGTGAGIYAKLAKGVLDTTALGLPLPTLQRTAAALIKSFQRDNSLCPRERVYRHQLPNCYSETTSGSSSQWEAHTL